MWLSLFIFSMSIFDIYSATHHFHGAAALHNQTHHFNIRGAYLIETKRPSSQASLRERSARRVSCSQRISHFTTHTRTSSRWGSSIETIIINHGVLQRVESCFSLYMPSCWETLALKHQAAQCDGNKMQCVPARRCLLARCWCSINTMENVCAAHNTVSEFNCSPLMFWSAFSFPSAAECIIKFMKLTYIANFLIHFNKWK